MAELMPLKTNPKTETLQWAGPPAPSDIDEKVVEPSCRHANTLPLESISRSREYQCRVEVDPKTVHSYAERMRDGDKFPPLDVFAIAGEYILVDGWHRYLAAKQVGIGEFAVNVHAGTQADAIKFAISANAAHGLPRTNKDKRCAVERAVRMFPDNSDRKIAEFAKVSQPFVGEIRRQLKGVISCESRIGLDGKTRKCSIRRPSKKSEQLAQVDGELEAAAHDSEISADEIRKKVIKGLTEAINRLTETYEWLDIQPRVANDCKILEALNKLQSVNEATLSLLRAERVLPSGPTGANAPDCSNRSLQSVINDLVRGMSDQKTIS